MTISLNSRNLPRGRVDVGGFSLSAIGTTVVDDGTCAGVRGERASKAGPGSWGAAARDRGGAGGTAAAATAPARGDVLAGTALSPRTPIASPSYPRLLRYTWALFPRSPSRPCAARWWWAGLGSWGTSGSAACRSPTWSWAEASASRTCTRGPFLTQLATSLVSPSGSTARMPGKEKQTR